MTAHPTFWLSFAAGALSFLSPCTLPLYPSYLSYISGVTFAGHGAAGQSQRWRAVAHTLCFILGFAVIFFALGLSATLVGQLFANYKDLLRIGGGVLVVLMGLLLSGLVTPKWMMAEHKWHYHGSKRSYLTSILVGVSFAAGWTPCIGPILGAVLVMAAQQSAIGIPLILAYIAGFAVPFLILAVTLGSVRPLTKYGALLSRVGGYVMIVMGLLLVTGWFGRITTWLTRLSGFTGV